MHVCIVGGGVAGLTAAYYLSRKHRITVIEGQDRLGGHTNTVDVPSGGRSWAVDTGFIVFNRENYPNFCRLLDSLGVGSRPTTMEFAVSCRRSGLEYNPSHLTTLFAQRWRLLSPRHWRMALEAIRFRRAFDLIERSEPPDRTLAGWLREHRYGRAFIEDFIVPLGAAVWSADFRTFEDFPLRTFVRFFRNHGFLRSGPSLQWRTVAGGSRSYLAPLVEPFATGVRRGVPATAIDRHPDGVTVRLADGSSVEADHVVLATHSDEALALLGCPTPAETSILGAIPFAPNDTVLHTDPAAMPRLRRVWASWNVIRDPAVPPAAGVTMTYWMNRLQGLEAPDDVFVSLNLSPLIAPGRRLATFSYAHPIFTAAAIEAQGRRLEICGQGRTHFCGAWWTYGFHEDAVASALVVARRLGVEP